jgi:hypothetical protein
VFFSRLPLGARRPRLKHRNGTCLGEPRPIGAPYAKAATRPSRSRRQTFVAAGERKQLVYETAVTLINSRRVSKGLFDRAVRALGHEGITDVTCLMGFYTSVSMTLAFYAFASGAEGLAL